MKTVNYEGGERTYTSGTPKDAPYKLAQKDAAADRGRYLVCAGVPIDVTNYTLLVRKVGDNETGHRKVVRK